jgi:hypothetical protein
MAKRAAEETANGLFKKPKPDNPVISALPIEIAYFPVAQQLAIPIPGLKNITQLLNTTIGLSCRSSTDISEVQPDVLFLEGEYDSNILGGLQMFCNTLPPCTLVVYRHERVDSETCPKFWETVYSFCQEKAPCLLVIDYIWARACEHAELILKAMVNVYSNKKQALNNKLHNVWTVFVDSREPIVFKVDATARAKHYATTLSEQTECVLGEFRRVYSRSMDNTEQTKLIEQYKPVISELVLPKTKADQRPFISFTLYSAVQNYVRVCIQLALQETGSHIATVEHLTSAAIRIAGKTDESSPLGDFRITL